MERNADVVVIGGGGAGMSAALFASSAGASVILLEADSKLGGATALSDAVIYAAGTSVQRRLGIEDSADAMYFYIMTLNAWQTRPDIIRILSDRSSEAIEWAMQLGVGFDWVAESGVDGVARGHCTNGGGAALCAALAAEMARHDIEVCLGVRAERLLTEGGAVTGVHADGVDYRAKAVVVTTGGFGNSPEMRARHFPTAAQHGSWVYAVHHNAPFILGDGIKLGEAIGAAISGHDTGLLNPSANLVPYVIEAYLPDWIMVVNDHGRRFMPENISYAVSGYLMNQQPNAHAWAVFSESALVAGTEAGRELTPYRSGLLSETWNAGRIRAEADNGRVRKAGSLAELAAITGIDGLALEATVERYNAACREGSDREWSKEMRSEFVIDGPPYYAIELKAASIGQTSAGLTIDADGRVQDGHGRPIPGLYAAGETLGCVQGRRYAGGGMGIASALVFGRLAGEEAGKFVKGGSAPEG